jgi:predicted RNase H-like HicB family nuclease
MQTSLSLDITNDIARRFRNIFALARAQDFRPRRVLLRIVPLTRLPAWRNHAFGSRCWGIGEAMNNHYIAILVPESSGEWTVLFPDLPGCATQGVTILEAQWMATEAAELHLETMRFDGREIPNARSLEAIRADEAWAREFHIDWTKVVISMIRPHRHLAAAAAGAEG